MEVRRRPQLGPPQLDQNIRDSSSPAAPTIMRITPTAWMLIPDVVALTAHVRIAPIAIRMRLTPIPMRSSTSLPLLQRPVSGLGGTGTTLDAGARLRGV